MVLGKTGEVDHLLEGSSSSSMAADRESDLIRTIKSGSILDHEVLQQLQGEISKEVAIEMLRVYLDETRGRVDRLVHLAETLNYGDIANEALGLAVSSETFGVNWLARLGQSIQHKASIGDGDSCIELLSAIQEIYQYSYVELGEYCGAK